MAYLSVTELLRLGGVRPELQSKLQLLMATWEAETGRRTFIPPDGGVRTMARQAELVAMRDAAGEDYAVASPALSRHPLGAAFDLHILGGGTDEEYRRLADMARTLGLVAGYYFKPRSDGSSNKDEFHFELNEPLDVSRAEWAKLVKKNCSCWQRALASLPSS